MQTIQLIMLTGNRKLSLVVACMMVNILYLITFLQVLLVVFGALLMTIQVIQMVGYSL